ncbi:MAG: methyltransferase domain-containing protein [Bacteroidales bacterium]|jgi:16S rRNA (guanine(966)-N(2))-methyltransferase RsmD|nr:methyltransferase domain-containing protein [Bacteroidales bacterium]
MRIVSGDLRGRRFTPPENFSARPTTDFAKENLFNVLANFIDFEEIKVLDIFSGTGSISYEFASRGCRDITSVEKNFKHRQFIAKTIKEFGIEKQVRSIKGDAFRFVQTTEAKYDLIFADPPFDLDVSSLPDIIFERNLLTENGLFILEHSGEGKHNNHPNFSQTRCYGKVNFTFFKPLQPEE